MIKPKIAEWKKEKVEHVKKLITEYPVFGIINMVDMPTLQLQRMRNRFKDKAFLIMTKKRLIKLAIDQLKDSKKNIEKMNASLEGMPALIFTKEDPFKLSKLLSKGKSAAAAKAGQIAPNDIVIPAGPTPFAPGPVIGELGQLGIKTEIKEGKIHIKEDKLVVKGGEVIDAKVANILSRLGIEPMEIGLSLVAVYDNGLIYTKDVLSVDEKAYIDMLKQIHLDAVALSVSVGYATKETVSLMLIKIESEVNALIGIEKLQNLDLGGKKMEEETPEKKFKEEKEEQLEEQREEVSEEAQEEKTEEQPAEEEKKEEPVEKAQEEKAEESEREETQEEEKQPIEEEKEEEQIREEAGEQEEERSDEEESEKKEELKSEEDSQEESKEEAKQEEKEPQEETEDKEETEQEEKEPQEETEDKEEAEQEEKPQEDSEDKEEEDKKEDSEDKEEEDKKEDSEEKEEEDKKEDDSKEEKKYDKGGEELEDKEVELMKKVEQITKDILEGKKVGG